MRLILLHIFLLATIISIQSCIPSRELRHPHSQSVNLDILRESIDYIVSDPNLFNAQVGIYIQSLDNDEVIFRMNEHKLFIPASNMKLFTTAVALLKFGPDFRYLTKVYSTDSINTNILEGDLIIWGGGDPTLSSQFENGDARNIFLAWGDSLKSRGINSIHGDIIGDESYFQNDRLGYGWETDDESFYYAAQLGALSFNDNCIDITVMANDSVGLPPRVQISPPTDYVTIKNLATTVAADCVRTLNMRRQRGQNVIFISQEIPINKPYFAESMTIENPARFFIHIFNEVLNEQGINIEGNLKTIQESNAIQYNELKLLFNHFSIPLADLIKFINKPSQNLYAEQLLLTIGAEFGTIGSQEEGSQVVEKTLAGMGISDNEFIMYDGSGLSRHNLLTPHAVISLLRYMARHKYFDFFYDSLPIAGVDGTLENRMRGTYAETKVRAKTGHVEWVSNLSGYITSLDNERFVFSILVNNFTVPTKHVHSLQEQICILLSRFMR